jgi:hypothetical protein
MDKMKIGIMQPYFFPYIGYFQLINAVDKFIFYDDLNFIKNGWINRNRILLKDNTHFLTIQLKGASSFKLIKEVEFSDNRLKLLKTLDQAYKRAPYFKEIMPLIHECLLENTSKICDQAIVSVIKTCKYLKLKTSFELSSVSYPESKGFEKADRLKYICKSNNSLTYVNPIGGVDLYTKDVFLKDGINLFFLQSNQFNYKQFNNEFVPWLSIIDVLMFNSKEQIGVMLNKYELI